MEIKKFGFYFLFIIIFLVAVKFYSIIYDFFPSIAAACVFAYLFRPMYAWLKLKTKHEHLAAFVVLGSIIFLVLIPLSIIILTVQKQMLVLFREETISSARVTLQTITGFIQDKIHFDMTQKFVDDYLNALGPKLITGAHNTLTFLGPRMIMSFTRSLLSIFIALFMMYYLLISSDSVVRTFRDYFPISMKNSKILLSQMGRDTKALIYGQLLIATMQGTLGSIGFLIFGVSGALFWGMIMIILSFLPFIGSAFIWLPAAVMLLAKGRFLAGIGLFFWGAFIVGTSDNIVRPKLTQALGELHPVTVLLGVFIGIKEWGAIGIVLGPLMISVLINLIKMFREEYITE